MGDDADDDIFVQWRRGVATVIAPPDAGTHFDLGMAYAEMGLLSDAITELAIVLEADPHHLAARAAMAELRLRAYGPRQHPAGGTSCS